MCGYTKPFSFRDKYGQLIMIKRRFDPDYIFTANAFGVDATNTMIDDGKRIVITHK